MRNTLHRHAPKTEDKSLASGPTRVRGRQRHEAKILPRRTLGDFTIANALEGETKVHACLLACNFELASQLVADAVDQCALPLVVERTHPSEMTRKMAFANEVR